ncbi:MAG: PilX N-terminal domain-containing pilus assembly protein, partial [Candidatus Zixiibacteriota bacterium]
MIERLRSNQGSALLMALLIMLMLTLIFAAAVTTSVTDIDIAKNQKERTMAFYTAEAGLQLAIGVLRVNFNELNNDTLEAWINASSAIGDGNFSLGVAGTSPFKT